MSSNKMENKFFSICIVVIFASILILATFVGLDSRSNKEVEDTVNTSKYPEDLNEFKDCEDYCTDEYNGFTE